MKCYLIIIRVVYTSQNTIQYNTFNTVSLLFQLEQSGKLHKQIADRVSNFHTLLVSLLLL